MLIKLCWFACIFNGFQRDILLLKNRILRQFFCGQVPTSNFEFFKFIYRLFKEYDQESRKNWALLFKFENVCYWLHQEKRLYLIKHETPYSSINNSYQKIPMYEENSRVYRWLVKEGIILFIQKKGHLVKFWGRDRLWAGHRIALVVISVSENENYRKNFQNVMVFEFLWWKKELGKWPLIWWIKVMV